MISLRKKTQTKKRARENDALRLFFQNTQAQAICMMDRQGLIVTWNSSMELLTGYTGAEAVGNHYSLLFSTADITKRVPQSTLEQAARNGQCKIEGIRVRKNGTSYWGIASINAIYDASGVLVGFSKIAEDVTVEKERDQQREEFIGIASHELKNPITTLNLYTEILAQRLLLENDKKNLQILRDMQGETGRLVKLIDDLLIASVIDSDKLDLNIKDFELNALLRRVIKKIQGSTTTHKITLSSTAKIMVQGDEEKIERVLINLINNAIKYSLRAREIIVTTSKNNKNTIVGVQDFGPGVQAKDRKDIFKRFFRARGQRPGKVAGFGLGLFICAEIIRKHHQKIWVESVKNVGSTFFFTLKNN